MARILVLGDDRAETDVLALAMESAGRRCTTIDSLQETIGLLQAEFFDLVVLGRLNGSRLEQVVKSLQNAYSKVLVMVITENSEAAQEAEQLLAVPCSLRNLLGWLHHAPGNNGRPATRPQAIRSAPRNRRLGEIEIRMERSNHVSG